jgi:hypothetical protein
MKNSSLFAYLAVAVLTVFLVTGFTVCRTSMAQQNLQEGLVVTVEVFSGRPNPSFMITDPSEIIRLRENLVKLPALATAGGDFSEFGRLGYRGIIITNLVGIEGIPSYVQVLEGKVKVCSGTKGANFFEDTEGMEKYYLGLAKDRGVIPADLLDRNIVPDPDAM